LNAAQSRARDISKSIEKVTKLRDKNISISAVVDRYSELKAMVIQAKQEMRALEIIIAGITKLKEEELKKLLLK